MGFKRIKPIKGFINRIKNINKLACASKSDNCSNKPSKRKQVVCVISEILRRKPNIPTVAQFNLKGFLDSRYLIHAALIAVGIFVVATNVFAEGVDTNSQNSTILSDYLSSKEKMTTVKADTESLKSKVETKRNSTQLSSPVTLAAAISNTGFELGDRERDIRTNGSAILALNSPDPEKYSAKEAKNVGKRNAPIVKYHTVQYGETLYSLAKKYGLSFRTLWQAKDFSDDLTPGDTVLVPFTDGTIHTVTEGQTLSGILEKYGASDRLEKVMKANKMKTTDVKEGQHIVIPDVFVDKPEPEPEPVQEETAPTTSIASAPIYTPRTVEPAPTYGGDLRASTALAGPINQGCFGGHIALDIGGPVGATVAAAGDGRVSFVGWQGGYGQLVVIDHGGRSTKYAHLGSFAVSTGQHVSAGQAIGTVGMTGWTTGPHLHYEVSGQCPAY